MDIILLWSLGSVISFFFAAFGAGRTLTAKYDFVKTHLIWIGFIAADFLLSFFCYYIDIYNDTAVSVTNMVLVCILLLVCYQGISEVKIFVGASATLLVTVLTFMFCGTSDQIWGEKLGLFDAEAGPYTVRNILFFLAVKTAVLILANVIYRFCFRNMTRDMLAQAKNKMRNYIIVPVVSFFGFAVITGVANSVGIVPTSRYFIPLYFTICLIFVVEYVMIFSSVHWASEALKAGRLGRMDGLTGLSNRMSFEEKEKEMDEKIARGKAAFSIIMIDLNFLKELNDNHGHDKGDIALKIVAEYIEMAFKNCEKYRIGGDEFAAVVEENEVSDADRDRMIENFRAAIRNNTSKEAWRHVSAAVGYAEYDENKDTCFDDVFKRADDVMYHEKKAMKESGQAKIL